MHALFQVLRFLTKSHFLYIGLSNNALKEHGNDFGQILIFSHFIVYIALVMHI